MFKERKNFAYNSLPSNSCWPDKDHETKVSARDVACAFSDAQRMSEETDPVAGSGRGGAIRQWERCWDIQPRCAQFFLPSSRSFRRSVRPPLSHPLALAKSPFLKPVPNGDVRSVMAQDPAPCSSASLFQGTVSPYVSTHCGFSVPLEDGILGGFRAGTEV
jgi:hypothetical protein